MRLTRRDAGRLLAAAAAGAAFPARAQNPDQHYSGERTPEAVTLRAPDGSPILRYQREELPEGAPRPAISGGGFVHPLWTPSGEVVTDLAPADHPHHRGVFCAWVRVEGEEVGDWWGWGAKAPKDGRAIVNREARLTEEGPERVTLRVINSWRAGETTVLGERLTLTARAIPGAYVLDFQYKFTVPTRKPAVVAASPFGGFCYRGLPRGVLTVVGPTGRVDLPNSVHDQPEKNWPDAPWYALAYQGERINGAALMSHPGNPPTTWHVHRGIHMLNPCIAAGGPVTIEFGKPLQLAYRLVVHDGDPSGLDLAALREEFAALDLQ